MAPAARASRTSWTSSCPLTIRTFTSGRRRRISRVATTPSIPGRTMSINTTSGRALSISWNAARAEPASPTTSYPGAFLSSSRTPSRKSGWSSTRTTLTSQADLTSAHSARVPLPVRAKSGITPGPSATDRRLQAGGRRARLYAAADLGAHRARAAGAGVHGARFARGDAHGIRRRRAGGHARGGARRAHTRSAAAVIGRRAARAGGRAGVAARKAAAAVGETPTSATLCGDHAGIAGGRAGLAARQAA